MATILIVDDSAEELEHLTGVLGRRGHDVLTAATGAEGIEIARSKHPDLVLMDVVMPEINGFQATRQLKRDARTADIPVVIISAKSQQVDRVWGERQGAHADISKPLQEHTLLATIDEVLGGGP